LKLECCSFKNSCNSDSSKQTFSSSSLEVISTQSLFCRNQEARGGSARAATRLVGPASWPRCRVRLVIYHDMSRNPRCVFSTKSESSADDTNIPSLFLALVQNFTAVFLSVFFILVCFETCEVSEEIYFVNGWFESCEKLLLNKNIYTCTYTIF
jgi:hypothetical protein